MSCPGRPSARLLGFLPSPNASLPLKQRKLVETAIERLVELLDEIDPEPDAEPSLGSTGGLYPDDQGRSWGIGAGTSDDGEEQCEDEGAEHDGREHDYRD